MKNKIFKFLPLSIIISSVYTTVSAMESIEDMENFFREIIQEDLTDFNLIEEVQEVKNDNNQISINSIQEVNPTITSISQSNSEPIFNIELPNLEMNTNTKTNNSFSELDVVFMRNIPEGTRFTINKDFVILPLHRFVIFHEGQVVVKSPQHDNPLTTFCYFELQPSGKARILREGRKLTVVKNETTSKTYRSKTESWRGDIKVFESKLHIDNPHLKSISCYSASTADLNKTPLRIKDLREQTGYSLSLEFPAYEEI